MTPGTNRSLALKGEPKQLDTMWRPVARAASIGLGLVGAALLVWFHAWWWVPAPLLVGVLAYEIVFWARGDRPIVATIEGQTLRVVDPKLGSELVFDLRGATRACLGVRRSGGPTDDALLTIFTDAEVALAVQLATPSREWPEHAADLRALQPVLGGRAALLRGLAPQGRLVRQTLHDPTGAGLDALVAALPESAFDGCAARVWRGAAPDLDFMGQHIGPADALLTLDARGWRLLGPEIDESGPLQPAGGGRSSRIIPLFDLGEAPRVARLPLLTWALHPDVTLAIPAPIAGAGPDPRPLPDDALHLHLPEAANLVWYLVRSQDAGALPEPLRGAIADSRIAGEPLPPALLRHLSGAVSPGGTADRPPST